MKVRTFSLLFVFLLLFTGCRPSAPEPLPTQAAPTKRHPLSPVATSARPKNIILLIGDGMGVAQISAAKIEHGPLAMERLPKAALVTVHAANDLLTDSAASATAMATGHKTRNGYIAVSPDGKILKTVLEYANERGKATGLVATSSITHATPAAFVAHGSSRKDELEIAEDIAQSAVDVLIAGGSGYFLPSDHTGGMREDHRDLLAFMTDRGFTVITDEDHFIHTPPERMPLAALLTPKHLPRADHREYSLARLTEIALRLLASNPSGFFLMVEGSRIDWGGHDKDYTYTMSELVDFDTAVGAAMDFAETEGNTLVVVTADHETGGLSLTDGSISKKKNNRIQFFNRPAHRLHGGTLGGRAWQRSLRRDHRQHRHRPDPHRFCQSRAMKPRRLTSLPPSQRHRRTPRLRSDDQGGSRHRQGRGGTR